MSPELLDPDQFGPKGGRPTKQSDCYALGMVIYEVLSGKAPFAQYRDYVVMRKVIERERPERPQGTEGARFTDYLWYTLQLCWAHQPEERPTVQDVEAVLECREQAPRGWKPPSMDDSMGNPPRTFMTHSLIVPTSTTVSLPPTTGKRQRSGSDPGMPSVLNSKRTSAGVGVEIPLLCALQVSTCLDTLYIYFADIPEVE